MYIQYVIKFIIDYTWLDYITFPLFNIWDSFRECKGRFLYFSEHFNMSLKVFFTSKSTFLRDSDVHEKLLMYSET